MKSYFFEKEVYQFLGKQSDNFTKKDWIGYDDTNWQSNTTQDKTTIINEPLKLINSWKERLTSDEIGFCESILTPYLEIFGYQSTKIQFKHQDIINQLSSHKHTYNMYLKYLSSGSGTESFPSDPLDSSTWE